MHIHIYIRMYVYCRMMYIRRMLMSKSGSRRRLELLRGEDHLVKNQKRQTRFQLTSLIYSINNIFLTNLLNSSKLCHSFRIYVHIYITNIYLI